MQVGDLVGTYRVVAALGEGGMGSVWKAFDERLQRPVALKVLKLSSFTAAARVEARERFLREARALAAVRHARVVTIYEVGDSDGEPFLAMEHVEGRSLKDRLSDGPIPVDRAIAWLAALAEALAAVHDAGIVHRDVKPANVVVSPEGEIKLVDFGIARAKRGAGEGDGATVPAGLATLTRSNATVGTPLYMAPEQIRGDAVGPAADQFAWGVTAYEVLAGRAPWSGETSMQILSGILERDPVPLPVDVAPDHVVHAVMRALAKRPGDRFASMNDVSLALRPTATADTMLAAPRTVPPSSRRAGKAGRVRRGAAVALLVVAAAGLLVLTTLGLRRDDPEVVAPPVASTQTRPDDDPAAPLRVRDLPVPDSDIPEARDAYAAGLRAIAADGSAAALPHFERAAKLDPTMAAARVRLLIYSSWMASVDAGPRFAEARAHDAKLTARDREILDALEPYYRLDPGNRPEARRRLGQLLERRPRDAEIWLLLSAGIAVYGDAGFISGLDRALEVEPDLPDALGFRLQHCAYIGDEACVRRSEEACRERAPASMHCLHFRSEVAEERGDCAQEEDLGRSMLRGGAPKEYGYRALLAGMASLARPRPAIEAVLRTGEDEGSISADKLAASRSMVAAMYGDFQEALEQLTVGEQALGGSRSQSLRGAFARRRAQIEQEIGHPTEAARVARGFLDVRDALVPDPHAEDYAVAKDVVPRLLRLLGEVEPGATDLVVRRDQWVADWKRRLQGSHPSYVWLHGYPAAAFDARTAREALEARRAFEPIAPFRPRAMTELDEGRMYALLGDWGAAEERLRRATKVCRAMQFPVDHVQAHELLGRVLEKKGDEDGACAAYAVVLDRWGEAKPKSVTADRARERTKALRCKASATSQ